MLLEAILGNALWATALAAVVFLVGHANFYRRRPAVMHLLWFDVLVKLVVPPLVAIPFLPAATSDVQPATISHHSVVRSASAWAEHRDVAGSAEAAVDSASPAERSWRPELRGTLLTLSLAGTLFFVARFARMSIRADPVPTSQGDLK